MTATHASIAPAITIDVLARHRRATLPKRKWGAGRLPILQLCCVASEAALTARVFSGDAHRESGVFSFGSALSPVESCSLQSPMSSQL